MRIAALGSGCAHAGPNWVSGGRLLLTLASELRRRGGGIGLVTICGGVGEAEAIVIEVAAGGGSGA